LKSGGSKFNEKPGSQFGGNQHPEKTVGFVRDKIRERNEFNARIALEGGGDVPEWTVKD
jgi:hypothetical protein